VATFDVVAATIFKSVGELEVDMILEEIEFVKLKEATLVAARRRANSNILPTFTEGKLEEGQDEKKLPSAYPSKNGLILDILSVCSCEPTASHHASWGRGKDIGVGTID
jgi:hypothetical protein